jgi:hypothetical protein
MPAPIPPFPRRGIPSPKSPLPVRRELPPPFFRTREGRRLIFWGALLLALLGTLFGKAPGGRAPASPPQGIESGPASRAAHPPRTFADPGLLHQIRTLEDFTRNPHDSAIASTVRFLESRRGPESRPAELDWTDLEIEDSLDHPEDFRGGLVRVRGLFMGIETREIDHPAVPGRFTYRGYVLCKGRSGEAAVVWETATLPPDIEKIEKGTVLDVRGVFLQPIKYQAKPGPNQNVPIIRTAPFLVADSVTIASVAPSSSIRDMLFTPAVVVLIMLILATTLFLIHKSRRSVKAARYVARPPGPGR